MDTLDVEQRRGITVKANTATMIHEYNSQKYMLNLIDTPGHVDFSYEVRRSLSATQGCLLVVCAVEGVQAQTIANFYSAFELGLPIIPIINKVDLQGVCTKMSQKGPRTAEKRVKMIKIGLFRPKMT